MAEAQALADMRRRPSGERPPLPHELGRRGTWTIAGIGVFVIIVTGLAVASRTSGTLDVIDARLAAPLVALRGSFGGRVARFISEATSPGVFQLAAAAVVVSLFVLKRHRRMLILLAALLATYSLEALLGGLAQRPRPYGVENVGGWAGYSFPSGTVTPMTALVVGICFCFFARGSARRSATIMAGILLTMMSASEVANGVDHLTDDIAGALLALAVIWGAFAVFAPDAVFPITRGSGNTAHLDLTGARADAIRRAVADQLGHRVTMVEPFGLEGSAGSTPMLLTVAGAPDAPRLFAKLYATSHVRSDRLYKLGRTLLYGRLEDETSFRSVKLLVEYEDYMMRLMAAARVPVVATYGIVELTPEREYLLVTEFAENSVEIGDREVVVDDAAVEEALAAVRAMWDAGLSHRDIKPANVLVKDGHIVVIDVAFGSVRPSPWRQAVDLANMMLVLALRADARGVYEKALAFFGADEIAEAFAATEGMTVPTQLRSMIHDDGRDLVSEFRQLAPEREPIRIQRWSVRRVALTAGVAAMALVAALLVITTVLGPNRGIVATPECSDSSPIVLEAQAVPVAAAVPCLVSLPAGWTVREAAVTEIRATLLIETDRAGPNAVAVDFSGSCDVGGMALRSSIPVRADFDVGSYEKRSSRDSADSKGAVVVERAYLLDGGCVAVRLDAPADQIENLGTQADEVFGTISRAELDANIANRTGGRITRV